MPRNRQDVPRAERYDSVVDAAEDAFLENGYGGTTMSEIAHQLGVASNALLWYLPNKDAALAAVVDRAFRQSVDRVNEIDELQDDPVGRIFVVLEDLRAFALLHAAMHDRAAHSVEVQTIHDATHDWIRETVREAMEARGVDEADQSVATGTLLAVLDGSLVHDPEMVSLYDIVSFAFEQVLGAETRPAQPKRRQKKARKAG